MNVTVQFSGSGTGSIRSEPAAIQCSNGTPSNSCSHRSDFLYHCLTPATGNNCSYAFKTARWITLIPKANSGSVFSGWEGSEDCADGKIFTIGHRACTARFEALRTLTVNRVGKGVGNISSYNYALRRTGINCGDGSNICTQNFKHGKAVILKAIPSTGSHFLKWSGDCQGKKETIIVKMENNKNCTANFGLLPASTRPLK
jgi:hypothetical protein